MDSKNCGLDQFSCSSKSNPAYCLTTSSFNCSQYRYCECPYIKGDSDIAGQGVIASFLASAAATLVLTIAFLILNREYDEKSLNIFDRSLRKWVCRPVRNALTPDRADKWAKRLYAVILSLSDSQLVSGIAMLASAIKLMREGDLIVYHFNIVSDLAWFSSNTHLLSLLVIHTYLDSSKHQHLQMHQPAKPRFSNKDLLRYSRIVLMIIMAVLLLYAVYISGAKDLYENLNCPMNCMLQLEKGGVPFKWTVINMVLILWNYPTSILHCVPILSRAWLSQREKIVLFHEDMTVRLEGTRRRNKLLTGVYRTMTFLVFWIWSFFASEMEAVIELAGWFILGVISVVSDRTLGKNATFADGQLVMSPDEWNNQDRLNFGQLVPLVLLVLPALTFIEAYSDDE